MNGQAENQVTSKYVRNVNPLIGTEKRCPKCKKWKPLDNFSNDKNGVLGKFWWCKECLYKKNKEWVKNNMDKFYIITERWRGKNRDKVNLARKNLRINNPEKYKKERTIWAERNRDKMKAMRRRAYEKESLNPVQRLSRNMSCMIVRSIKTNKYDSWKNLVGYDVNDLKRHLEKQFNPQMTWDNYGSCWEIDHIIPVVVFNFDSKNHTDFKRCWALKNLRPLLKSDNRKKGAKLNFHFQPSLKLKEVPFERI